MPKSVQIHRQPQSHEEEPIVDIPTEPTVDTDSAQETLDHIDEVLAEEVGYITLKAS